MLITIKLQLINSDISSCFAILAKNLQSSYKSRIKLKAEFGVQVVCISQVLDEGSLLVLSSTFEEGETSRHRQLLPLRPPRVVASHKLYVLFDPLSAQSHQPPGVQVSVVPLPDNHSQVHCLSINQLNGRPPGCIPKRCDVFGVRFWFCFEEIPFAGGEDEGASGSEILAGQSVGKNISEQLVLMSLRVLQGKALVFKVEPLLLAKDVGEDHDAVELFAFQYFFELRIVIFEVILSVKCLLRLYLLTHLHFLCWDTRFGVLIFSKERCLRIVRLCGCTLGGDGIDSGDFPGGLEALVEGVVEGVVVLSEEEDVFAFGEEAVLGDFGDPEGPLVEEAADACDCVGEGVRH